MKSALKQSFIWRMYWLLLYRDTKMPVLYANRSIAVKVPEYHPLSFYKLLQCRYIKHAIVIKVKLSHNRKIKKMKEISGVEVMTSLLWKCRVLIENCYFESAVCHQKIQSAHLCFDVLITSTISEIYIGVV